MLEGIRIKKQAQYEPVFSVLSIVFNVYVKLVEGDFDAFLIKRRLYLLHYVRPKRPVIRVFRPYAGVDVNAACRVSAHSYVAGRVLKREGMRGENFGPSE